MMSKESPLLGYLRVERWDGKKWRRETTPYRTRRKAGKLAETENGVRVVRVKEGVDCGQ